MIVNKVLQCQILLLALQCQTKQNKHKMNKENLIKEILKIEKTKHSRAYLINMVDVFNTVGLYYDSCSKQEVEEALIQLLNDDRALKLILKAKTLEHLIYDVETIESEQIEDLLINKGLTIEKVYESIIKINSIIGVGLITLEQNVISNIKEITKQNLQ
jgi:hypothetical protein